MRKNKNRDMLPFDLLEKPKKPNVAFLPLMWAVSRLCLLGSNFKIQKKEIAGLKPPFLVLSMHQGFMDYYITPLTLFPHRVSYVSDMEGFANFGKWLYSQLGCIGTRRFVNDTALVRNISCCVKKNKNIVVVFPEARHSNVGTNSEIPTSIGKLIKLLNIPVVVQKLNGSYLNQPIWDEKHRRKAPIKATLEKILDVCDISKLDVKQLTQLVNKHFQYDEYKWQYENKVKIDYPNRAEGLEKILYLCPNCKSENQIESNGSTLTCKCCSKQWEMSEYGRLCANDGNTEFAHIPDWYEFQRKLVQKEIDDDTYYFKTEVEIDALPNEKGFVNLGRGVMEHTCDGFSLTFYNSGQKICFPTKRMNSLHTEYGYGNFGDCIVLSTKNCCYYLHNSSENLYVTKTHFATEIFHDKQKQTC